jgi:formyl-CoA transferase
VEVPDAVAGSIHVTGKMIKFSRTPMVVGQTPVVGQHTREILSGVLGYSGERIEALSDAGVIRCGNDSPGPAGSGPSTS